MNKELIENIVHFFEIENMKYALIGGLALHALDTLVLLKM